ncbi:hypothetical protein FKM82_021949 [Ascaphus truei]|uniref:histone H2B-like n=1 Tax=Ascaphus truei TaxID=8439 RepID=UPI003F5AC49C
MGKQQVKGDEKQLVPAKKKRPGPTKKTYSSYISKVLKQVHPDMSISCQAMSTMNALVNDLFERIAAEAGFLAHYSKRCTIISCDIQSAVRLTFPENLATFAVAQGIKATTEYTRSYAVS